MSEFRLPVDLAVKMEEFATQGPEKGINNFIINGSRRDVQTIFKGFIGVFPYADDAARYETGLAITPFGLSLDPQPDARRYYREALGLSLPRAIARLPITDAEDIRRLVERVLARNAMPSIVLGFARAFDTEEDLVVLFSIPGYSPQTALRLVQQESRGRLASFS